MILSAKEPEDGLDIIRKGKEDQLQCVHKIVEGGIMHVITAPQSTCMQVALCMQMTLRCQMEEEVQILRCVIIPFTEKEETAQEICTLQMQSHMTLNYKPNLIYTPLEYVHSLMPH